MKSLYDLNEGEVLYFAFVTALNKLDIIKRVPRYGLIERWVERFGHDM